MSKRRRPPYEDTVLLHLESGVARLNSADGAPDRLPKYAAQILQIGKSIAEDIHDAPGFAHETLRWSVERVDQISSLWAYDIRELAGGVDAAAHVLKSTAFFQARAISSAMAGQIDGRSKAGRDHMTSLVRGHSLCGIADRLALLAIRPRLSAGDVQMLNEWSAQLDDSARLFGLVSSVENAGS